MILSHIAYLVWYLVIECWLKHCCGIKERILKPGGEEYYSEGICLLHLLIVIFALPIAIIYGLIALVYLLFGSCFKLCNICKSKRVSPGKEGQSSDALAENQSADHVLHV